MPVVADAPAFPQDRVPRRDDVVHQHRRSSGRGSRIRQAHPHVVVAMPLLCSAPGMALAPAQRCGLPTVRFRCRDRSTWRRGSNLRSSPRQHGWRKRAPPECDTATADDQSGAGADRRSPANRMSLRGSVQTAAADRLTHGGSACPAAYARYGAINPTERAPNSRAPAPRTATAGPVDRGSRRLARIATSAPSRESSRVTSDCRRKSDATRPGQDAPAMLAPTAAASAASAGNGISTRFMLPPRAMSKGMLPAACSSA